MSFYYDLTPYIKSGENVISVRVDNSRQPNTRWYSGSGIYRHVWLTLADSLHVAPWGTYIITPVADSAAAIVSVKSVVENKNSFSKRVVIRSIVLDGKGIEVAKAESNLSIEPNKNLDVVHSITVSSPSRWSIETPNMYSLRFQIIDKGKIIDEVITPFGIRNIKYDLVKGFLLNGKRVKMNGVCLHHDAGSVGAAVPEAMWVRRLKVLKEMGCNAIRTSHNPVAPEFLDLCDRMGFLVQDEIFD
jgi:beta-galactosidase